MSKVTIQGDASGTGIFTIASPNSNTDRTLVLPDEAGTVLTSAGVPASAMPAGSVLQVLQAYKTDTFSTTASGTTDITGLSISITPSSTSSKILITSNVSGFSNNGSGAAPVLKRNGTKIGQADSAGNRQQSSFSGDLYTGDGTGTVQMHFNAVACFLDSPNTTSFITYNVAIQSSGYQVHINREENDLDNNDYNRCVSHITVMEIAG
jgi:hypothetical protein